MAKVPLRKYNSEIESLIDRGQTDEAIAHCRHILKTFPKHLETYRLLGKAYLETKKYPEATDIFKRVLTAVPGDFVSHAGLSIIADDQKRLEDAVWHMERAFEAQPSNAAIQAELQRLYGRRDGHEPPKIRLTRGALAHMYVQGELYAQAISEIRSVLGEDLNRTDMQALLALAHFRSGHKVEASETCSQLIVRYPYCLDANRILVEILPGTGLAESVQTYRQRVVELDPYAAYASGSIFQSNEVQDAAVTLERLEYKGQPVESGEWSQALGIGTGIAAAAPFRPEPVPPPVRPVETPPAKPLDFAPPSGTSQDKPAPAASAPDKEEIPDWMREAGWGESSGAFDETAPAFEEETAADELPKAVLPDWIKSMAPSETQTPPIPGAETPLDDETMEWLNKLGGDKAFAEHPQEAPAAAPASPGTPIGDLGTSAADQDAAMLWLEGLAAKQGAKSDELITKPEERTEKPPEWVEQVKAASEPQPAAPEPSAVPPADDLAGWLSKLDEETAAPAPPVEPAPAAPVGELGTSAADQDAAMLWLEGLAAKQGAKSEELITKPEERLEKPPEWVEQAKAAEEPPAAAPEPPAADLTGVWLRELDEKKGKEVEAAPPAQAPAWSGEIEFAPPPVEPETGPAAPESDLPTWLRGLGEREAAPASQKFEEMPEWLRGEEPEVPLVPQPTQPADWTPEAPPEVAPPPPVAAPAPEPKIEPEFKFEPKPEPLKKETRKPQPKPSAAPPPDKTKVRRTGMLPPLIDPNLALAREAMQRGKIPDALQAYGLLIRKGKLLEDITFDLKEALYRFPVEVSIWQVLGDAYMRANRLQDALDAYTKAEELLR